MTKTYRLKNNFGGYLGGALALPGLIIIVASIILMIVFVLFGMVLIMPGFIIAESLGGVSKKVS